MADGIDAGIGQTILVVEADTELRELLVFALEFAGYHVVACDDAEDAWRIAEFDAPHLAVVEPWLRRRHDGMSLVKRLRTRTGPARFRCSLSAIRATAWRRLPLIRSKMWRFC